MSNQVGVSRCQAAGNTSTAPDKGKRINASRHWCFTLNNYSENDIKDICAIGANETYVFQEETGENGTPHLQGYIGFKKRVRPFNIFKNNKIHWEICRDIQSSIYYCQKEETRTGKIYSTMPVTRVDTRLKSFVPREWQSNLYEELMTEPDDRTITWVVDVEGGKGKSLFCKWLNWKHPEFLSITMNKSADILTVVEETYKGYLIDLPRSYDTKYTPFNAIEQIKNGYVTEGKLKSKARVLNFAPPHVVIFSNQSPNLDKLSMDRWKIIKL